MSTCTCDLTQPKNCPQHMPAGIEPEATFNQVGESRKGWIVTFTGVKWFVTDPQMRDVRIEDIAHALSMACRFGGHTKNFYSVAEHSVRCAIMMRDELPDNFELQLHTLLHDASEAYIGDVVRPLKHSMPDYCLLEKRTMKAIRKALRLNRPTEDEAAFIKYVDDTLLMTERRDLINHQDQSWGPWADAIKPLSTIIFGLDPASAKRSFLAAYYDLQKKVHDLSCQRLYDLATLPNTDEETNRPTSHPEAR